MYTDCPGWDSDPDWCIHSQACCSLYHEGSVHIYSPHTHRLSPSLERRVERLLPCLVSPTFLFLFIVPNPTSHPGDSLTDFKDV